MKLTAVSAIVFMLGLLANGQQDDQEWLEFKKQFLKQERSLKKEDEPKRYRIWKSNNNFVKQHNQLYEQGKVSFRVGVDEFSIYSDEEFSKMRKGLMEQNESSGIFENKTLPVPRFAPSSIDWRKRGYVTPVKDQGSCGSCWAFAAIGAIEGQLLRKGIKLTSLSSQQLLDCVVKSYGCYGGWVEEALLYSMRSGNMDDSVYPYIGYKSSCKYKSNSKVVQPRVAYRFSGESSLRSMVAAYGPMVVLMYTNTQSFRNYRGGIYYEPLCNYYRGRFDHAMLVVGYGSENGIPFWIVKNTWGTRYGENGYIRVRMGLGNCGIGTYNLYTLL